MKIFMLEDRKISEEGRQLYKNEIYEVKDWVGQQLIQLGVAKEHEDKTR